MRWPTIDYIADSIVASGVDSHSKSYYTLQIFEPNNTNKATVGLGGLYT
jgi:hypothetical protein